MPNTETKEFTYRASKVLQWAQARIVKIEQHPLYMKHNGGNSGGHNPIERVAWAELITEHTALSAVVKAMKGEQEIQKEPMQ